jgi:transcriptional regulator with XRE-family HTH domain
MIIGAPLSEVKNKNRDPFPRRGDTEGMKEIGLRLRYARKLRKLTQEELAKRAGVKQASVSDLERGESKSFRGVTLVSIARVLNVRAEWLSQGKGAMERKDLPLSDQALAVAQAFDRLAPDVASKIADMIFSLPQKERSENYVTDDEHEPVGGGGKHGRRRS